MKRSKLITILVIAIVAVIIAVQNTEVVDTKLLFVTVTMPRVIWILCFLVLGFAAGALAAGRSRKK